MRWAVWTGEGVVIATIVGVTLYIAFSYLLTNPFVPKRPMGEMAGSLLRETILAVVITLLPFYVAVGHKRGRGDHPVVLVHGYTQNRVNFIYLSRFLRARGLAPIYGFNYFSFGDIRSNGKRLARFVERVCKDTGATSVDLVCHSMGGLVARQCIRLAPGRVRRCVTIASPHSGVRYRVPIIGRGGRQLRAGTRFLMELSGAPLGVPMLSIFSTHDNIVAPAEASASLAPWGGSDFVVDHVGHLAILFDKRVANAVADFLLGDQGKGQSASESTESGTTTAPPLA